MGQDTPNFNLYKPAEGEDGWAQEVNDNWDTIDSTLKTEEAVQDIVGGLIQANGNISVTYDDANDVLTIDTSALNEEEVEDAVAGLITAGNAITVNYDDPNDSLSIAVDESSLSFYDGTNLTADVDNQSVKTEELTGGIAGSGNSITAQWGNENEEIELVGASTGLISKTITSTSYTNLFGVERPVIDLTNLDYTNITEIKAQYTVREVDPQTNNSASLKGAVVQTESTDNFEFGEQTISSSSLRVKSTPEAVPVNGDELEFNIRAKTSDGNNAKIAGIVKYSIIGVIG